ncbi:MAG: response regulator [Pyrinomonadaceae bacterium]
MEPKDRFATSALPGAADQDSRASTPKDDKGPGSSQRTFLVLVVDDAVDNVVVMSLYLQQEGYRVVTATDGEEAVRVAGLTHPDIILMDIGMPRVDGLEATRKIRDNDVLRNIPVIAITAFGTAGFRRAAYDAGIEGYLVKPVDFQRLNELMKRLLAPRNEAQGDPRETADSSGFDR